MFKGNTLFVLGAGASADVGMPVGQTLAEKIRAKSNVIFDDWGTRQTEGDVRLFDRLRRDNPHEAQKLQEAAWRIRDGLPYSFSIDDFLDSHQHDRLMVNYGKAAIVRTILEYERSSQLFVDQSEPNAVLSSERISDSWLPTLVRIASRGVAANDPKSYLSMSVSSTSTMIGALSIS